MVAGYQQKRGDLTNAIATWRRAVAIAEDPRSPGERFPARTDELISVLQKLSSALSANGEFQESTELAMRALKLERSKLSDQRSDHELATTLVDTAATFVRSGDPAQALPLYEQSLGLVRSMYRLTTLELQKAL